MSVQTQIDRITDNVTEQTELIKLIKAALEGKSVSGGGGGTNLPIYAGEIE